MSPSNFYIKLLLKHTMDYFEHCSDFFCLLVLTCWNRLEINFKKSSIFTIMSMLLCQLVSVAPLTKGHNWTQEPWLCEDANHHARDYDLTTWSNYFFFIKMSHFTYVWNVENKVLRDLKKSNAVYQLQSPHHIHNPLSSNYVSLR